MSKSINRGLPARLSDTRALLDRILDAPQVVQRLQPDVLHRVIQHCGLEDCSELVALATADQLKAVFDIDLWHASQPGSDEQFDAERFGVWLEVLVEAGEDIAAQKLSQMDAGLVASALAQHVRALVPASAAASDDSELASPEQRDAVSATIGGYTVVAKRTDAWDGVVATLIALDAGHSAAFHAVMRRVVALSNEGFELDGLDSLLSHREQAMFDLAVDREQRREQQGFATPAQARAFLQAARALPRGPRSHPPSDPVARAYFRSLAWSAPDVEDQPGAAAAGVVTAAGEAAAPDTAQDAYAAIAEVLGETGLLPQQPRALLHGPEGPTPRLRRIQMLMEFVREHAAATYETRGQELAYLANTLMAGCSVQARPLTPQEASDGAVAICNLGLENWPRHWLDPEPNRKAAGGQTAVALPDAFLVDHDLVTVFQLGWAVLYQDVCMDVARRLVKTLARVKAQSPETQADLNALRKQMKRHCEAGSPWLTRDAMEVIAILDMTAWAALLGLIDECPTLHAALGAAQTGERQAISATAFEFIADNGQIATIRAFMNRLPELLEG